MTETRTLRRQLASERGAFVIQTGVAILVLSAFAMFIVDYGALWVSRHQAQNAADAGALAGATALAFDDFDDRTDTGPAKVAAQTFALANTVWGEAPDVQMATDVRFYADAPADFPAGCASGDCIRVDVYRNQARNNALPTFFGWLVGVSEQGVRATATARAATGNASNCLKPWAILDKWFENPGPWDSETSEFDPYTAPKDTYQAPTEGNVGSSYTLEADLGRKFTLKLGNPQNAKEKFGAGWFSPIQLGGMGGNIYRDNISGCNGELFAIGDTLGAENGNMQGPTKQGVADLIALDKDAKWDEENDRVYDSCVGPPYTCSVAGYKHSPRIVALPVVNTLDVYEQVHPGGKDVGAGNLTVTIVAILGFFVEGVSAKGDVTGYLATKPDLSVTNGGGVNPAAGFLKTVQLVR